MVKADEWDLSKVNSPAEPRHIQKWCKADSGLIRYSNLEVAGYQPCGELKTMVVCNASGRKLISSGPAPYGYKECSETPRIFIERIGPPLPEKEYTDESNSEPISLAKNFLNNPNDQMEHGLETYQNYINGLDKLVDDESPPKKSKTKTNSSLNLNSLPGGISPAMLSEAMKLLTRMGQ